MQELLANYLLTQQQAVLPHIGMLCVSTIPASSIFGDQKIAAPVSIIELLPGENDAVNLIDYIASNNQVSLEDARQQLDAFCEQITTLPPNDAFSLPHIGKFSKDETGKILFEGYKLPEYFLPAVHAERVVHPNESHTMLVGDTETNTAAMAEYYTGEAPATRTMWWIWALVLLAIATAAAVFYFNSEGYNPLFGNAGKWETKAADSTYRILP